MSFQESDVAAERALIASVLIAPSQLGVALEVGVESSMLIGSTANRLAWNAITELHAKSEPVDATTVAHWLAEHEAPPFVETSNGDVAGEWGKFTIGLMASDAYVSANAGSYAQIIVDYARQRYIRGQIADAHEAARLNGSAVAGQDWRSKLDNLTNVVDSWYATDDVEGFFVNMRAVMDGETFGEPPAVGIRSDKATALFYAGKLNNVIGESESGKSLLVQSVVVEQLNAGNTVVFLDYEKDAGSVAERLLQMGATREAIEERFLYQRREDNWTNPDLAKLRAALTQHHPTLAVVDGVTNAMTLEGLNPLSNMDVSIFYAGVPALLAWSGAAVAAVDHVVKSREGRLPGALGGQHKRAGIDGASFELTMKEPAGRGRVGHGTLNIDKDAPGWLRTQAVGHKIIADVTFDSDGENLTVRIDPSSQREVEKTDAGLRMTRYMERVSKTLEAFADGASGRQVEQATTGRNELVRETLKVLVAEGFATVERNGSALVYRLVRPYREGADPLLRTDNRYEKPEHDDGDAY